MGGEKSVSNVCPFVSHRIHPDGSEYNEPGDQVAAREADAVAGFLALKRDMLAQVEAELNRQAEASAVLEKSRLENLTAYEQRLTEMREELLSGLEEERLQLREKGKRLQQALRDADWAKSDADELKQSLEHRLAESLSTRQAEFDERMKAWQPCAAPQPA